MLRLSLRVLPRQQRVFSPAASLATRFNSAASSSSAPKLSAAADAAASAPSQPTSRELIAEKSKQLEGKYAAALKRKMEA